MKIVSTSSKYDGAKWVANISNNRNHIPVRVGFHAFEQIAKANPSEIFDFDEDVQTEEEIVMNALRLGWPVRIHRTYVSPGAYEELRKVESIEYDLNNTDAVFTVNSRTSHVKDMLDLTVYPNAWPTNLCKVYADRYSNPAFYIGENSEVGIYAVTPPRLKCIAGSGLTFEHPSKFVVSAVLNDEFAGNVDYFDVDQNIVKAGADGLNKHHVLPTEVNEVSIDVYSETERRIRFSPNAACYSITKGSGGYGWPKVFNTGDAYTISAGHTVFSFTFAYDRMPTQILIYDESGAILSDVRIPNQKFTLLVEYETVDSKPVSDCIDFKGEQSHNVPIIDGSYLRFITSNYSPGDPAVPFHVYNYNNGGAQQTLATGTIASGKWYPLGVDQSLSPVGSSLSYAYRLNVASVPTSTHNIGVTIEFGNGPNTVIYHILSESGV